MNINIGFNLKQTKLNKNKTNLADLDHLALKDFFLQISEKPFRAVQLLKWIYKRGIVDFNLMTDLSKQLREKLQEIAVIEFPEIIKQQISKDGTHKWLVSIGADNVVEMVFIPEKNRGTLCISSQVGCPINCSFCLTAKQGFSKNLTTAEIIGQVWLATKLVNNIKHPAISVARITNVVLMGMGEPLLNFDAVIRAVSIMCDDNSYNLSKRKVTISTAGVVPGIEKLINTTDVALAISLHAPTNALRDQLVPLNRKYPIEMLIEACKKYLMVSKINHITVEYVMLKGFNDRLEHARQLIKILSGFSCKVNLIPFNYFAGSLYSCSTDEDIYIFNKTLNNAGIVTTMRTTRGYDINAACGQLVGKVLK